MDAIGYYNFNLLSEVRRYCEDRLDGINEIIEHYHTPEAVSLVFAFMGFLSRLACCRPFGRRTPDNEIYERFLEDYFGDVPLAIRDALYGTARCGLLHTMALANTPRVRDSDAVRDYLQGRTLVNPARQCPFKISYTESLFSYAGVYTVINGPEMVERCERAIKRIFEKAYGDGGTLAKDILDYVRLQPPVNGIRRHDCDPLFDDRENRRLTERFYHWQSETKKRCKPCGCIAQITSDGMPGVGSAALNAADHANVSVWGYWELGWRDDEFLRHHEEECGVRAGLLKQSIQMSYATLILVKDPNSDRTREVIEQCERADTRHEVFGIAGSQDCVIKWLKSLGNNLLTLNVVGTCEYEHPGIWKKTYGYVSTLLDKVRSERWEQ